MSPIRPPHPVAATLLDHDTSLGGVIRFETPEWLALMDWCEFHGIDPNLVPAGSLIERHASQRCINYVRCLVDVAGAKQIDRATGHVITEDAVEQGEAPPLPFPEVVAERLSPVVRLPKGAIRP